jgi:hypothetical protein
MINSFGLFIASGRVDTVKKLLSGQANVQSILVFQRDLHFLLARPHLTGTRVSSHSTVLSGFASCLPHVSIQFKTGKRKGEAVSIDG